MTRSQPDFFIVGAPKCGTTSLDRYLSEHPQVFMGEKESHHFSDDLLIQTEPLADRDTYLALFAQRGDEKRAGESSVYYLQSRKAARNIHEFDPEAKIIMHFRNPIELLYSHHSQLLYEGIQEIEDFSDALDAIGDRRWEDDDIRARVRVPEALDYWGVVDFLPQIERYREVFPAESLHVILFDDLMSDPEGVYKGALDFLGVDSSFAPDFTRHNRNKVVRSPRLREMLGDPPPWISVPARLLLPLSMRNRIKQRVKRANTRFVQRAPMAEATRRRLADRLETTIRDLGTYLGRDLSGWLGGASVAR